jgi:hypothetical protein
MIIALISSNKSKKIDYLTCTDFKFDIFAPAKFSTNWSRSSMDRTSDSGSESWGFESLRDHEELV